MKELIFQVVFYIYPGLAIVYGFWAILHFGAKNTLSLETQTGDTYPDWLSGLHFLFQAIAFFFLYFATKDLPINTNAFSFIVRMWWAAAFVTGLAMSIWHFGALARRQWKQSKLDRKQDEEKSDG